MDANLFQILGDPTRLRLLDVLRGGEFAVGDLVERVDIQQSGVSRHLHILQEAGLVAVRREGQRRLYSLRPEPLRDIDVWLSSYRAVWETRLDRFEAQLERLQQAQAPKPSDIE